MYIQFNKALRALFSDTNLFFDPSDLLNGSDPVQSMIGAFLCSLTGDKNSLHVLQEKAEQNDAAQFLLDRLKDIESEINEAGNAPEFSESLVRLAKSPEDPDSLRNLFFPEGTGLPGTRTERVNELRNRRTINITQLNPNPLTNPGSELLFTSNVLLTIPADKNTVDHLNYSNELKSQIIEAMDEEQSYWYDHPIQIGVKPENNEILYGLRGLNKAIDCERKRGNMPNEKATCILSVSVTHNRLRGIAKNYIETEIKKAGGFKNLDVYVFTESDTRRLIEEVLAPVVESAEGLDVFGVDGEYGRHYSFLKAIAPLWQITKDRTVRATFKIDLDQIFPQDELVEQSGASAFEHFMTPLWGAHGTASNGDETELGMIAGALVNEKDIQKGLFTPDVPFSENGPATLDEQVFFSKQLMALSTEGELMTRYGKNDIDGKTQCIQRIHVTGGTNGILIDSLRRHRPFTPSFIGRAEDQSYILSILMNNGEKLAYVHEDGLIMRHDKEAFAADAIKAASFGNLIGDYIRTLYFSEYTRTLTGGDIEAIKTTVNPFTGCFISHIPVTVVMMRFCMKAAEFFLNGDTETGSNFVLSSFPRLADAIEFAENDLHSQYLHERNGWDLFYNTLTCLEENTSEHLRKKAADIIDGCCVAY